MKSAYILLTFGIINLSLLVYLKIKKDTKDLWMTSLCGWLGWVAVGVMLLYNNIDI